MSKGIVYLVGAGPGDPGLITVRGAECLGRADIVIYDRLVHPDLLNYAPPDAEQIYVGKESTRHTRTQTEINALVVARARAGKTVCRLKGGDPFVFGRGGEEAGACVLAGLPFEVVPGVTSAIAAPAYAGIPITHRDSASSFAVITGHERDDSIDRTPGDAEGRRDWAKIANAADTLVFLMGIENLDEIATHLVEHGRDPDTPVALIRWGTWPKQETLVSTLGQVLNDARSAGFKPPAVMVVGDVVHLRESLRWFDTKPLFGKRILVTRAREQASALSDLLREHGADPVEFPVIRIATLSTEEYESCYDGLHRLDDYDWIIFTSVNSVKVVWKGLQLLDKDTRAFANVRVAAIGPATADELSYMGIRADFVPSKFVAESILEEWPNRDMAGQRVLIPRAKEARDVLPEGLKQMGAHVDIVAVYKTLIDAEGAEAIRAELTQDSIHAVTFTSSSTVKNFVESMGQEDVAAILKNVRVASIGPITSQTASDFGLFPQIEAKEHTIPGLVTALVEHFQ